MRSTRNWAKNRIRDLFEFGQRFGVNILPKHFYSSIPDIIAMRNDDSWRKPFEMCGVAGVDLPGQIAFLEDLCPPSLVDQWPTLHVYNMASVENGEGGGYGIIEAEILHAFVRRHCPQRIVQIGCGLSTSVILRAASMANYAPDVVCVEPHPSGFLLHAKEEGRIALAEMGAEKVDRNVMTALEAGDMLFVDSTHTVKPGSEVNRVILDVLPRLVPGVFIHFHDIHFPYDYQRELLSHDIFFHAESTLLHAFLINNACCRILLSSSMLHYWAPERIAALLPHYRPQGNADGLRAAGGAHYPSATYLLTTKPS